MAIASAKMRFVWRTIASATKSASARYLASLFFCGINKAYRLAQNFLVRHARRQMYLIALN